MYFYLWLFLNISILTKFSILLSDIFCVAFRVYYHVPMEQMLQGLLVTLFLESVPFILILRMQMGGESEKSKMLASITQRLSTYSHIACSTKPGWFLHSVRMERFSDQRASILTTIVQLVQSKIGSRCSEDGSGGRLDQWEQWYATMTGVPGTLSAIHTQRECGILRVMAKRRP